MFSTKDKIILIIIYLIPFCQNFCVFSSINNTKTGLLRNLIEKNISDAYDFAETLINKSHKEITLADIKKMHWHIYKSPTNNWAGKFRNFNYSKKPSIENPNAESLPTVDYKDIPQHMDEFIEWLHHSKEEPLKIAADSHMKLVDIHPFPDGNGRTARLLMNLILVQNGYSPAVIDSTHNTAARDEYLDFNDEFRNNRPENYYAYISKCIEKGKLQDDENLKFKDFVEQPIVNQNQNKLDAVKSIDKSESIDNKEINNKIIESNISDAYDFAETLIDKSHKEISLADIKKIHWHIYKGLDDQIAGKYRDINYVGNPINENAGVQNVIRHVDYKDIPRLMDEFMDWLHYVDGDALQLAADAHVKLIGIHPFQDGNGRTSRLLMNLILVQNGYSPAVIDSTHNTAARDDYLRAVNDFYNNQPENYYAYISKCIEKGQDQEEKLI
jgi:Fic family protein